MLATPAVVLGDSLSQFSLATPTSSIAPVPALHTEERGGTSRVKQEGELEMLPRSESKIRTLVGAIGRAMSRDRRAEGESLKN